MRKEFRELTSVEKAFNKLSELRIPTKKEKVNIKKLNGRVSAESIRSPINVPQFDRSTMDGYAVKANDTYKATERSPTSLLYKGEIKPGEKPNRNIKQGETFQISTGAMIPKGADSVIKIEDTTLSKDSNGKKTVKIRRSVAPGDNIMFSGYDVSKNERILKEGLRIDSRHIGLLSSVGISEIPVYKKPRVGVISTGKELVRPGKKLGKGEIYDINSFSISTEIKEINGIPIIYQDIPEKYNEMSNLLSKASKNCDIIISSGSTSASELDVLYKLIEKKGELLLHGISIKPGRPTIFGYFKNTPYIGLPGNPISALMIFRLFGSPLIKDAAGIEDLSSILSNSPFSSDYEKAKTTNKIRIKDGRTHLIPVGLIDCPEKGLLVYNHDKGSGAITSLSSSDGYIVTDSDINYVPKNKEVKVNLFNKEHPHPEILGMGENCIVIDKILDKPDSRWISMNSKKAIRNLKDGVPDIICVTMPINKLKETKDVEGILIRGYKRQIGFISKEDLDIENIKQNKEIAVRKNISFQDSSKLNEIEKKVQKIEFGSSYKVANTIKREDIDIGICLKHLSKEYNLKFTPLYWENLDFAILKNRKDKKSVKDFMEELSSFSFNDLVGYKKFENTGEKIMEL